MQKLAIGMPIHSSKYGFTLIEILVVIVIISIITSIAVMSYGDFGEKRKSIRSAEYFISFFGLVKKEAMLEARPLAIQITKNKYRVLELKKNNWKTLQDKIFTSRKLPNGTLLFLYVNSNSKRDLIIIYPAGNITPFKLKFGKDKNHIFATIIGKRSGSIKRDENAK